MSEPDGDVLPLDWFEALQLRANGIGARHEEGHGESSRRFGDGRLGPLGAGDGDRHAGHGESLRIDDEAGDGACRLLSQDGAASVQQQREDDESDRFCTAARAPHATHADESFFHVTPPGSVLGLVAASPTAAPSSSNTATVSRAIDTNSDTKRRFRYQSTRCASAEDSTADVEQRSERESTQ